MSDRHPEDAITAGLAKVRLHKHITMTLLLGLIPAHIFWDLLVPTSDLTTVLGVVLTAAYLPAILIAALRQFAVPCPRCGKPYFRREPRRVWYGGYANVLASRCVHCRLPIRSSAAQTNGEKKPVASLGRLALSPTPYGVWSVLVAAALIATYFVDPYVFAFTTLGLGALTAGVALVGVTVCVRSRAVSPRSRALILLSLAAAGAAVVIALAVLRGIRWG